MDSAERDRNGFPRARVGVFLVAAAAQGACIWPTFPEDLLKLDATVAQDGFADASDAFDARPDTAAQDTSRPMDAPVRPDAGPDAMADVVGDMALPVIQGGFHGCTSPALGVPSPRLFAQGVTGSRDLAFDGRDLMVTGNQYLVRYDSTGTASTLTDPGTLLTALGMRYLPTGDVAFASVMALATPSARLATPVTGGFATVRTLPAQGTSADGGTVVPTFPFGVAASPTVSGGFYVSDASAGVVWWYPPGADADAGVRGSVAVGGLRRPVGITVTPDGSALYVCLSQDGVIQRLPLGPDGQVNGAATQVATMAVGCIALAFDDCGSLYVSLGAQKAIKRYDLAGSATGALVFTDLEPQGIAFGRGTGFSRTSMYLVSGGTMSGQVWSVDVGVPGAPLP